MSANKTIPHCFFILLAILASSIVHADELLLQGEDALKLGKFSEALAKFEQALSVAEKKKDSSQMADAFYKIGVCQNSLAKYAEATRALNEAEKLHRQVADQQAIGFDLTEMGRTESLRANFDESLKIFEKALAIHQQTKSIKGEADTLKQIGNVHLSRGDYEKALTFSQQALALATQISDKQLMASSEKDIGAIHFRQGEYDVAMQHLEISMKNAEEIGDKRTLAQALSNVALIYSEKGDFDRELEYYGKSGKLAEEIGDVPQQCVVLLNSAAVYFNKGEFKESNDYFQRALKLSTEIENKRFVSGGLLGLAMVQFAWGTNDVGLDYLRKAQVIAEQIGDKHVLTYALNELGWYASEAGDYATSMKYFQRSLAVREEMNDKRGIAASLNYLAHAYFKLGKYQDAMDSCTRALAISEALGIKKEISTSYEKMALIHQSKKEMAEAENAISRAIEISKALGDRDLLSEELHTQGTIFRDNNQIEEALASLKEEVQVIESIRAEMDLPERKAGYLETRHDAYADLIDLYLKQRRIPEAFEFAQRSKARAFLDMLAEIQIDPLTTEDPDLQKKKSQLLKEMVDIHNQIDSERENENPDLAKIRQLTEKRNKLDEQYSNLAEEIRQKNPYLAQVKYPQTVGLSQSQNLLDEQTILLEYFIGETGSLLFAITKEKAEVFGLPNEEQVTARIKEIRDLMQKPEPAWEISNQSHTKYVKLSSSLYKMLLKPAEAMFKRKQRIVIAPDGPLYYLPFEGLITVPPPAGNLDFSTFAYFAIQHEIQYVPSASVLAAFEKKQEIVDHQIKQKDLLVFADPALGSGSTGKAQVREWVGQLSSLPYTRDEAKAIAGIYPNDETSVLIGKQASEKNAKTLDLAGYKRIHFASHGLIDEERPQFSALVLSADSTDKEDGFLTMPEIFDLKLNADLVVLSACKTGLGKRIRGEGVIGISRAFLCAGASSVLVSLWNVYDRSSAEFMTDFYRAMEKEHKNKADALREARLEMIRGKKYSHPYYWAPFVLIGSR